MLAAIHRTHLVGTPSQSPILPVPRATAPTSTPYQFQSAEVVPSTQPQHTPVTSLDAIRHDLTKTILLSLIAISVEFMFFFRLGGKL